VIHRFAGLQFAGLQIAETEIAISKGLAFLLSSFAEGGGSAFAFSANGASHTSAQGIALGKDSQHRQQGLKPDPSLLPEGARGWQPRGC
jgi:hypothetical protein